MRFLHPAIHDGTVATVIFGTYASLAQTHSARKTPRAQKASSKSGFSRIVRCPLATFH
jgi:hypothetical protein